MGICNLPYFPNYVRLIFRLGTAVYLEQKKKSC
jgi:hypothetical protein